MAKTDTRPWAFDDSPQWQALQAKAHAAGLSFTTIHSGGADARYRGDTMRKLLAYGPDGALLTAMIVKACGPDGIEVYFASPYGEVDQDVQFLRDLALKHAAREA